MLLNFGARTYDTSTAWFLKHYPHANLLELKAWEIMKRYWSSFDTHPEVELHREGVDCRGPGGGGGLARGHGVSLLASGGAFWPLATAHSDPLWVQTCVGRVNGAPG